MYMYTVIRPNYMYMYMGVFERTTAIMLANRALYLLNCIMWRSIRSVKCISCSPYKM